ncbi:protein-glutamate methylesterase/protein-glutamine glutaminase [Vagococcus sp. WN89Y]|uniref:protein-glutamate methylesterase/protein-glutamine glutaminase n=1 Tax=Vagococcus sp. WN89Y TaxID=3457258 RepID=UPI003FCDF144
MMKKIKVLCIDDSSLIRRIMTQLVNEQPDMEMIATAPDPLIARDLIKKHNPDVLTLDVEMPRMDGLDFLERLMRLRPMPVVMLSSLTSKGSEITLRALELGAVDFITKPQIGMQDGITPYSEMIADKLRMAAKARIHRHDGKIPPPGVIKSTRAWHDKIIAIGSSTGGTEALRQLLIPMPADAPPIVIAQHMPPGFTRSFAERLNHLCQLTVKEAEDGERVLMGHAYIAPGDFHMELKRNTSGYYISLNDAAPVNRHRPSVDALFTSVARSAGKNATGAILTGMGNDGAAGLLAMRQAGAWTIAQSERSCVVFGMPREAIALNAACAVTDLELISQQLLDSAATVARKI